MEPPLASVRAVLERHEGLAGVSHVASAVSSFLDTSASWTIERAACQGHVELLKRLGTREAPVTPRQLDWAMRNAADAGNLRVIQWLTAYKPDMAVSTRVMDSAALRGHLHVVEWLHEFRSEGCTTHAMDSAAAYGRLEMVQWLHRNRTEGCTTAAMDSAAAGGHLKTLQWLAANRNEGCTTVAINFAGLNGHLRVLWWLREHQRMARRARFKRERDIYEEDEGVEVASSQAEVALEDGDDQESEEGEEEPEDQEEVHEQSETRWLTSSRRERRASGSLIDPSTTWDQLRRMRRYH